jgi:hypothetical protein
MPNTALVIDIVELFKKTFGKQPYVVPGLSKTNDTVNPYRITDDQKKKEQQFTDKGSLIKETFRGVEVLLPIRFYDGPKLLQYLPFCSISVSGGKTIIRTPLAERIGTVKEEFNLEDYSFNIKGFLINEGRTFPEAEIIQLRELYEVQRAVTIENALTNIYLTNPTLKPDEQKRVVISKFDLPEVLGGRHARPFTMTIESDTVFDLELDS